MQTSACHLGIFRDNETNRYLWELWNFSEKMISMRDVMYFKHDNLNFRLNVIILFTLHSKQTCFLKKFYFCATYTLNYF